jgi:hypothetical protein
MNVQQFPRVHACEQVQYLLHALQQDQLPQLPDIACPREHLHGSRFLRTSSIMMGTNSLLPLTAVRSGVLLFQKLKSTSRALACANPNAPSATASLIGRSTRGFEPPGET